MSDQRDATPEPIRYRGPKILAIGAIATLLVGFGVEKGGGLPDFERLWGSGPGSPRVEAEADLPALEGDDAIGPAALARWNDQPTRTQQFQSELSAREVADLYARQLATDNIVTRKAEEHGFVQDLPDGSELVNRFDSPYYSIVVARDREGRHTGIVSLPRPEGGSTYFVSQTETVAGPALRARTPVRPSNYDVPAPPFGREEFAIDGVGEPGSRLVLYHSRADRARILRFYRDALPALGYERLEDEGDIVNERMEKGYVLLFRRDRREVLIATMPRKNGIEAVTVMSRNKQAYGSSGD